VEHALSAYGVVIDARAGNVDVAATAACRANRPAP